MGDHADGVGRVTMHGKTCEVKMAEPKNHPVEPKGRPGVRGPPFGGYQFSTTSIHHEEYALPPYYHHHHHPYPPFVADPMIAEWMEYPTVPGPYQGYPGAMAGYHMAPSMYYPTDNMAPMYYPTSFPTTTMPMSMPMTNVPAPMYPPADYVAPVPAYYHNTGHEAYPYPCPPYPTEEANPMGHHHHPYAFGMASPMNPAAPPAQQTSVMQMQPVAPAIPVNEEVPSNAEGGAEGTDPSLY
jgi:hypothetical protein